MGLTSSFSLPGSPHFPSLVSKTTGCDPSLPLPHQPQLPSLRRNQAEPGVKRLQKVIARGFSFLDLEAVNRFFSSLLATAIEGTVIPELYFRHEIVWTSQAPSLKPATLCLVSETCHSERNPYPCLGTHWICPYLGSF